MAQRPRDPATPSRNHSSINAIVRELATAYGLPLPERDALWSPSSGGSGSGSAARSAGDLCFEYIKYLYYNDRSALTAALDEFKVECASPGAAVRPAGHVDLLLNALSERKWMVQNSIANGGGGGGEGDAGGGGGDGKLVKSRKSLSRTLSRATEKFQNVKVRKINFTKSAKRRASSCGETDVSAVSEDDYLTAPQSPTPLTRSAARQRESRKRPSDGCADDASSKFARTAAKHEEPGHRQPVSDLWSKYRNKPLTANTSFASTVGASTSGSASTNGPTSFSTIATSFGSIENGDSAAASPQPARPCPPPPPPPPPARLPDSSSETYAIDSETLQYMAATTTARSPVPPHLNRLSIHDQRTSPVKPRLPAPLDRSLPSVRPEGSRRGDPLEHHQVRQFPAGGLFLPADLVEDSLPFHVRYECTRVAVANNITVAELMSQISLDFSSYDNLWTCLRGTEQPGLILPEKSSRAAWEASINGFKEITIRTKMTFDDGKGGLRFKTKLQPLSLETSCRFQRKFGGDRLLYVEVPSLDSSTVPNQLKQQRDFFVKRFAEWRMLTKVVLGRRWKTLHFVMKSKGAGFGEKEKFQRLVFFAEEGPGLERIPVRDVIDWHISLANRSNLALSYCKAFARLDIGFSTTTPAYVFKPSSIRYADDIMADNSPEDSTFNDPALDWPPPPKPGHPEVMNDGCSRISVGAVTAIWSAISTTRPQPSVLQARIGGCKGVWMRSGPVYSKDPVDTAIWIETTPKQRKYEAHDADMTDNPEGVYEEHRLTFEVVNYSRTASADNLYMDFLPILQDRGVKKEAIGAFVTRALEVEKRKLMDALQDPVSFRRYMHEQSCYPQEFVPDAEDGRQATKPKSFWDSIVLLLEAGFEVTRSKHLSCVAASFIKRQYAMRLKQTFHTPLARSTTVIGVADPLGVLKPGQIHLSFASGFFDEASNESYTSLAGREALVTRHPTLRRSDIQKVTAVYEARLAHLTDVVVFPTRGCYPLAAKLQGGDYDGDTFWICWEPSLTDTFQNAPLPAHPQRAEELGIEVDRRSLGDMLADGGVDTFLQEVFEFKSRPDFLGIVTNLHSKCAYAHGTIHSRQINAIADLHDYLVDAAKNGYVFGEEAYEAFQATAVGFHGKSEAKPAYRRAIAAARTRRKNRDGTGSEPAAETEEAIKYKRHDISDHVYFEVIDPHVEATVREFERSCSAAVTEDGDIGRYLLRQLALVGDDDAALAHALAELRRAVAAVKQRWCGRQAGRSGSDSAEYDAIRALCADMYRAIQPCEGVRQHPVARRWAAASPLPGVPSEWSLLKAAVLCDAHHDKHYFVFAMAGRELAFLKATCRAGAHILVAPMWATLKPRRAAKAREAAAA